MENTLTATEVRCNYSITTHSADYQGYWSVDANAIVAEYGRQGLEVPAWFTRVVTEGARYSFEDFDTLSAAMRELNPFKPGTRGVGPAEYLAIWERIGKYRSNKDR